MGNKDKEFQYQCRIFTWAAEMMDQHPELAFLEGSMNGIRLTPGVIQKAKRAGGLKKGRPDIHLPVKRGEFGALFIELKTEEDGSRLDPDQEIYLKGLQVQGNYVCVCIGFSEAIRVITEYITGTMDRNIPDVCTHKAWWRREDE